jgi:hypothetical protein
MYRARNNVQFFVDACHEVYKLARYAADPMHDCCSLHRGSIIDSDCNGNWCRLAEDEILSMKNPVTVVMYLYHLMHAAHRRKPHKVYAYNYNYNHSHNYNEKQV